MLKSRKNYQYKKVYIMLKRIFILTISSVFAMSFANAQVLVTEPPLVQIPNSSAFLDASSLFGEQTGRSNDQGVGLVFPTVNLVTFRFNGEAVGGGRFPTFFDGMIVYNNATGTTNTNSNLTQPFPWDDPVFFRSATATTVEPGFYFFYNPNGRANHQAAVAAGSPTPLYYAIRGGEWRRIGDGGAGNVGGSFWRVDGNTGTNPPRYIRNQIGVVNGNPIFEVIRDPVNPGGEDRFGTTDNMPIIVYAGVRTGELDDDGNPVFVNRAIMHIGSGRPALPPGP